MTKRMPLCAWCGKLLTRKAHMRVMLEALPGKPEVGWHYSKNVPTENCVALDPLWDVFNPKDEPVRGAEAAYAEIERRGRGRIT